MASGIDLMRLLEKHRCGADWVDGAPGAYAAALRCMYDAMAAAGLLSFAQAAQDAAAAAAALSVCRPYSILYA